MSTPAILSLIAEAARWAWNTSLIVALPALLLLVLGRARRFPARARWLVGAALVLRLLLPSVPQWPGVNWAPARHLAVTKVASVDEPRAVAPALVIPSEIAPAPAGVKAAPKAAFSLQQILPAAWAFGAIVVFGWIALSHGSIRRRIARSARVCADERVRGHLHWAVQRIGMKHVPELRVMPSLPTVALWGWRRPSILVPPDLCERFNAGEVRGIFLHELAHVRRHDVLWTWVALAASALHWFNPLVWLMVRRFRADRELECDRIALALLDEPQRRHFGEALLKTLEAHQWPAVATVVPFALHQPEIRTRILMITRPQTAAWTRIIACIAAPCLVLLALGNAVADGEKEPAKARDGDGATKPGLRDGEGTKPTGAREGEGVKKTGARDGEGTKPTGARDGEGVKKTGARDGEGAKTGARDGEGAKPTGAREGEGVKKTGARDGEGTKTGARDGEGAKPTGARDGEGVKKTGARDGEGVRKGTGESASSGNPIVLRVVGEGENVSVDGETIPFNRLRGHLSEYLPAHPGQPVVIEADDNVPYKFVAGVLDAARDNGAKNASVRTSKR